MNRLSVNSSFHFNLKITSQSLYIIKNMLLIKKLGNWYFSIYHTCRNNSTIIKWSCTNRNLNLISDCLDIRTIYHINATSFRLNKDYSLYYVNISQNIVTGLIPLVSLVILNYLVYKHLKERRKGIFDLGTFL